jgi:hypothetical protein
MRFLAMDWIEGETLYDALERRAGIELAAAASIVRQVAEAVAEAHRLEVLHRDIKPANIMLLATDSRRTRIVDFGLARWIAEQHALTRTGFAVGTPGYMAPEQVRGRRDIDGRLDIFALGCVLYECLAGHPPFEGESPLAVHLKVLHVAPPPLPPEIPDDLVAIVHRMLQKDPAARFPTMTAVAGALDTVAPLPRSFCRRAASTSDELTVAPAVAPSTFVVFASVRNPDLAWQARAATASRPWHGELTVDGTLVVRELALAEGPPCAFALARELPDATIVLTAARDFATRAHGVDAITRGTRVLSVALLRSVFARGGAGGRVHVDPITAALLRDRFDIVEEGPLRILRERTS